ncbi:MAG TPA: hypothetical protein VIQ60_14725, partial [Gemmatimonadaceae bacterium]
MPDGLTELASRNTVWQSSILLVGYLPFPPVGHPNDARIQNLSFFPHAPILELTVRELVARAPVRIDFGGGWTDVPPYTTEHGGCVCSVAISRYAAVRLRVCDDGVGIDEDGIRHRATSSTTLGNAG